MSPRLRVGGVATAVRLLVAGTLFVTAAIVWRATTGPSGRPPVWWVVAATVIVAAVLWWAQPAVDRLARRLVHRERADAESLMDELVRGMTAALPVDEVVVRLAEAAGRHRQRAEVRVWLADGTSWGQSWPPLAPESGPAYRVDVRHGGDRVGEIEVATGAEPISTFDRRILDELAAPAGVALSTVRLTVDLRRREAQLTELNAALAASSDRLRLARAEQRARMEAEVARQVRPHLDAAIAALDDEDADPAVVRQEATRALDAVRSLARGIHPPRLTEDGLVSAVDSWRQARGCALTIDGTPPEPLPDDLVRVCYFCLVTILDAVRDAGGSDLVMSVPGSAHGTVPDTGEGGARPVELTVAASLTQERVPDPAVVQLARDRAEAFDGALTSTWTAGPDGVGRLELALRIPRPGPDGQQP